MAITQQRLTSATVGALNSLIHDGRDVLPAERPRWLEASWLSLPVAWQYSWFGVRLNRILTLQLKRGRRDSLEQDLELISQTDSQRQRESYSFVRTVVCAMPILGILGTAISFGELERIPGPPTPQLAPSQTVAASAVLIATPSSTQSATQSSTQSATQSLALSPASNEATLNLAKNASRPLETLATLKPQSALDTTALALVLMLATMLVQLIVFRTERDLLEQIDMGVQDTLIEYLAADPHDAEENLLAPVKQMSADLVATIHQIVEQQATIWSRSIAESQRQWSTWTQAASECIASNLTETITEALKNHASRLEKIQDEGSRQIDTRWQQWQTTLSDQARAMSSQQKELIRQTDSIQQLVAATTDLRKLEETILESVGRLENIHRLEDASQCVGEAVAVLATSLERAGIIRGAPVRPRVVRKPDAADSLASVEDHDTEKVQQRKSA